MAMLWTLTLRLFWYTIFGYETDQFECWTVGIVDEVCAAITSATAGRCLNGVRLCNARNVRKDEKKEQKQENKQENGAMQSGPEKREGKPNYKEERGSYEVWSQKPIKKTRQQLMLEWGTAQWTKEEEKEKAEQTRNER